MFKTCMRTLKNIYSFFVCINLVGSQWPVDGREWFPLNGLLAHQPSCCCMRSIKAAVSSEALNNEPKFCFSFFLTLSHKAKKARNLSYRQLTKVYPIKSFVSHVKGLPT
jgi:hypothetical protein